MICFLWFRLIKKHAYEIYFWASQLNIWGHWDAHIITVPAVLLNIYNLNVHKKTLKTVMDIILILPGFLAWWAKIFFSFFLLYKNWPIHF